jgi:hypothetical protein
MNRSSTTTTRKLVNINGNTNEMFMSLNCSEFYQHNILLLYPSVNTDGTIPSIYTKGITMKKTKSMMMCHLYRRHYVPTVLISMAKSIRKPIGKLFPSS